MRGLIEAAEGNHLATLGQVAAVAPHGATAVDDGVHHVATRAGIPTFNQTAVAQLPEDVDGMIDAAFEFHERHRSPVWCITVPERDADRFGPIGERRGFRLEELQPMMVLEHLRPYEPPSELVVREVDDEASTRLHLELVARSFGAPLELLEPLLGMALRTPTVTAFIGEVDGEAVATSLLCVSSGAGATCAGVYNVGTLDGHRRRGLGEAMTAVAAEVGRERYGCTIATLQSTPMGHPLYERMGYRVVSRREVWLPAPTG